MMNEINERAAFESHLKQTSRYTDWTKDPDGKYQKTRVQDAWEAWLASATLRGYAELDLEYANRYRFLRATNGKAYVSFNEKPNWKPCGSLLDDAMDWAMESASGTHPTEQRMSAAARDADAERYRWLREASYDAAMPVMFDYDGTTPIVFLRRATIQLDRAIDAARDAEIERQGGGDAEA